MSKFTKRKERYAVDEALNQALIEIDILKKENINITDENIELKVRIDKAIEYIKTSCPAHWCANDHLIAILTNEGL